MDLKNTATETTKELQHALLAQWQSNGLFIRRMGGSIPPGRTEWQSLVGLPRQSVYAGVVMLSIWTPPVMSAEELARLPGRAPTSVSTGR